MSRGAWIKKCFEPAVAQGVGEWIDASKDSDLGDGVFGWTAEPEVRLFENGFSYGGPAKLKVRYDDITGVDLLNLPALLKAQKAPEQPVQFTVRTVSGSHALRVHLYLYSSLSGTLNALAHEAAERR